MEYPLNYKEGIFQKILVKTIENVEKSMKKCYNQNRNFRFVFYAERKPNRRLFFRSKNIFFRQKSTEREGFDVIRI